MPPKKPISIDPVEPILDQNELSLVISRSEVEPSTALALNNSFLPMFERAKEWSDKARSLKVTNASQVREMRMAREARLALKDIRIEAEKTKKALKEDSIKYGRAVQGVYNVIEDLIVPTEQYLKEQEDFVIIQEEKRLEALRVIRRVDIEPLFEFALIGINTDLGLFTDEEWIKVVNAAKKDKAESEAKIAKIESDRIAAEQAREAELELTRIENEKLKTAAIIREQEIEKERAAAEEIRLAAERELNEEKLRITAENKAIEARVKKERDDAIAKANADRIAAEKRAAEEKAAIQKEVDAAKDKLAAIEKGQIEKMKLEEDQFQKDLLSRINSEQAIQQMSDKDRLIKMADDLDCIILPEFESAEAGKVVAGTRTLITKITTWIREQSNKS